MDAERALKLDYSWVKGREKRNRIKKENAEKYVATVALPFFPAASLIHCGSGGCEFSRFRRAAFFPSFGLLSCAPKAMPIPGVQQPLASLSQHSSQEEEYGC